MHETTIGQTKGRSARGTISLERLMHARAIIAKLIMLHGSAYIPIFERLDREVEAMRRRDATLERVARVARGEL